MNKSLLTIALLGLSIDTYSQIQITSVFDGPLPGGLPKGVELYVSEDIADLSLYGIGSANNGGGSDGQEFTFPATAASAGDYIYISTEEIEFANFFGFQPTYTSSAMSINGDDAIELFMNGSVIDLFGDINTDGTGQPWEYLDGWAHRPIEASPSAIFTIGDWAFSGPNALDGETSNQLASAAVPVGSGEGNGGSDPIATPYLISEIQGNPLTQGANQFGDTDVSPLIDELVIIEGIVVGDFQSGDADSRRDLNGFYVQEETSDEDSDLYSSEGIFVFDNGFEVDVNVGDLVRVTGTVNQYFGETQLDSITAVEVLASNQLHLVTVANLSLLSNTAVTQGQNGNYQPDLEAYEGMLVTFSDTLQIAEQFQLDRFNEIKLVAGDRPWQFTQTNLPEPSLYDSHRRNIGARTITYDDGLNAQNASISNLDGFDGYNETSAKRMGDTINALTGVLDYKWAGNSASGATWRVRSHIDGSNQFTSALTDNSPNPRTIAPEPVGGTLKVASFNVLNFFSTLDDGNSNTAVGLEPRGADDLTRFGVEPATAEFERQLLKLINAITALDADVLGLIELENEFDSTNDGSTAIEVLVNSLNDYLGGEIYHYVYPGSQFVGSDAIAVGFIYKPAVVEIAADSQVVALDDEAAASLDIFSSRDFVHDPIFNGPSTNRVSLAVSFTHKQSMDTFTIVNNHFKSKGSSGLSDNNSPNFDQNNGAGFWNQRRLDAAIAVSAWLDTKPTGVEDDDVIILGDLNAYLYEEPVQYLLSNGFQNTETADTYSYVFDGQTGTLDYLLVSDSLAEKLAGVSVWHINSDEADALDYNLDFGRDDTYYSGNTATRNSDHDPVIAGFHLAYQPTSVYDILLTFINFAETGEIKGNHHSKFSKLELYRFGSILYLADKLVQYGKITPACRMLSKAEKFSDGNLKPKDLILGDGVAAVHSLLKKAIGDLSCK